MGSLSLALERTRSVELQQQSHEALQGANTELKAINGELEAFSYSASHDLRTPVRHVMGFAELAQSALKQGKTDTVDRHLEMVKQAATRMNALIDGMLVLSRASQQDINPRFFDLDAVVRQARQDVEQEFPGRAVQWQLGTLPTVRGEPGMIQQVMTNLLSNAVKYSGTQEASEVKVWAVEEEAQWVIRVQDNGIGFDPVYAEKLFGIFQRLHAQTVFRGTGVGLATVKRIVLKHGGQVFAENLEGAGAVFGFTLSKGQA